MEQIGPGFVAETATALLPQLAALLAVVDAGSFTAAARRISSDKSVLSRRVKALEDGLGVRLLNRTTRSIGLTAAGRRLVDEAREPIEDALAALVRTTAPDRVEGTVRVTSAHSLAQAVLVPALAALRRAHPDLQVELNTHEALTPLVDHGYELGIRIGRMPDSSLISRKLATWRHVLVASPAWVAEHPGVRGPGDLVDHWVLWSFGARAQRWRFSRGGDGLEVRFDRCRLVYDGSPVLIESVRAGLGVSAVPPFAVDRELAEGSLVRLLPEWRVEHELGVFGVTPHRAITARVQVVLEAVRARLQELEPVWAGLTDLPAAAEGRVGP